MNCRSEKLTLRSSSWGSVFSRLNILQLGNFQDISIALFLAIKALSESDKQKQLRMWINKQLGSEESKMAVNFSEKHSFSSRGCINGLAEPLDGQYLRGLSIVHEINGINLAFILASLS